MDRSLLSLTTAAEAGNIFEKRDLSRVLIARAAGALKRFVISSLLAGVFWMCHQILDGFSLMCGARVSVLHALPEQKLTSIVV